MSEITLCPTCAEPMTVLIIEDTHGQVIAASWICKNPTCHNQDDNSHITEA